MDVQYCNIQLSNTLADFSGHSKSLNVFGVYSGVPQTAKVLKWYNICSVIHLEMRAIRPEVPGEKNHV